MKNDKKNFSREKSHPAADSFQRSIYNDGERLVPGLTHDWMETVRHKSAYRFFYEIIRNDLAAGAAESPEADIIDLGCGVGHGSYLLSAIAGSRITGVDSSCESLEFARQFYQSGNIRYAASDLNDFIAKMPECDWAVSHQALEHVACGLDLAKKIKFRKRLIFDVPYDEAAGNAHHLVLGIKERDFSGFPGAELFYQDLAGVIYDASRKPVKPNLIICVCGSALPRIGQSRIEFPFPAWELFLGDKGAAASSAQTNPPAAPLESPILAQSLALWETREKLRLCREELDGIYKSRSWRLISRIRDVRNKLKF